MHPTLRRFQTETARPYSLLGKNFGTPVLKTMWPFFAAGAVIFYGISSFAVVLANTDEYKYDPRNPNPPPRKDSH